MPEEESKKRSYDYYEKYVVAKQRNARREFSFYALMSLAQIHQIAGGPDQNKAAEVMHELMGLVLAKDQTREMYIEFAKTARSRNKVD